jgi:hypothetical protein
LKRPLAVAALLAAALAAPRADAFCGFYVAKADTRLFNQASQVALVREGDDTVLTMANDFQGDPKEFAVVVPVPTLIQRDQIDVVDKAVLDHLDAYSAPRLVEYHDEDPCTPRVPRVPMAAAGGRVPQMALEGRDLGVTVEATYTVGEYDIVILSARESTGLETWLVGNGYRIPEGAASVLGSYIKQGMRFFVARVNLKEQAKLGFTFLRPLRVAYRSPKFMLPIRLGTVNARGPQDLFVFALTRKGRVETTNYRTVRLPTGMDLPPFVKSEFKEFYKALFADQVRKEDMRVVFLEYAWDMRWCDPCAANPLSPQELRQLGVSWVSDAAATGGAQDVFLSRLHVRYDAAHFPEDLVFQETGDRENFQGRYVLRHPWRGQATCEAAVEYRKELAMRQAEEARNLANLTGWPLDDIRRKMGGLKIAAEPQPVETAEAVWYRRLWRAIARP